VRPRRRGHEQADGYLATVSRKLAKPLAVMVQSSSAAGKSALMDAVLAFVPEEERVQYSAMTGQSALLHGRDGPEAQGAGDRRGGGRGESQLRAQAPAVRRKALHRLDGQGSVLRELVTHEYHVEGPAAILLTTTAIDLDEELLNRCVVLAVDESREQTRAIHERQRADRTLEGLERRLARQDLGDAAPERAAAAASRSTS
jgi:DNA primase